MIKFYNTFSPPVPLFKMIEKEFEERGKKINFVTSKGNYRSDSKEKSDNYRSIWVPKLLASNKLICHFFYYLIGPFEILFSKKSDLNVFITQPPLFFVIGAFLSRARNTPYAIQLMDMYPELPGELGKLKKEGIFYKVLRKIADNALRNADQVIVIGRCMKKLVEKKGVNPKKIELIENWTNTSIAPIPHEDNQFRKKHGLEGKFVVLYQGNMGHAHEFETILETAKELKENSDIHFLFVGRGVRRHEIEKECGLENITLFDYVPIEKLPYSLNTADIHFICLRDGFEGIMVPSKFYSALATGRPILYEGNRNGELAITIEKNKTGKVVDHGDAKALKDAIITYYKNSEIKKKHGKNAINLHRNEYEPNMSAGQYVDTILNISA